MQAVIEAQEGAIKELAAELRRMKRENLRMRLHVSVLVGNPCSKTAEEIRNKHQYQSMFLESILHYN